MNVKNVKECVKKVNIYMKKVTSSRNVNKATDKTKKKYKNSKYVDMCIKIYNNIYMQT